MRAEEARRARRRSLLLQGGLVAVVLLVVVGVTAAVLSQRQDDTTASSGSSSSSSGSSGSSSTPAGFTSDGVVSVGSDQAPVTLTLVEDFACPACRAFEAANASLFKSYASGDEVRLDYRPIAFLDRVSTDGYSSRALNAAACVVDADQADWPAMHEALYASQPAEGGPGLSEDELVSLAVGAGADEQDVRSCIADDTFGSWVESTTGSVTSQSWFTGTPTVLVDGTPIDDVSAAGIQQAVEDARGE